MSARTMQAMSHRDSFCAYGASAFDLVKKDRQ